MTVLISLKLDQLERFIPNLFEYKGDLLVLDADKKVVFSSLSQFTVLTDFKQQDLSIQRFSGNQLFRSNDNEVYHTNQYVDDTTGWQVIPLYNRKY